MKTLLLKENLYYVGVVDHGLEVFDAIMPTKYGTTYNSYLLKTNDGAVLFEGSKAAFEDEYLENIASLVDFKDIKYIVVAHTEPDHSGAIEALLRKNPEITVLASAAGLANLRNILRFPFKSQPMVANKELVVGQYTLHFISGLFCHWPDVMFTYIKEAKALVSCDAFGAHYATDDILLSKEPHRQVYEEQFNYYFAAIMSPFASYAIQAADRVDNLDLDMILTGHGPVIDTDVHGVIEHFRYEAKKYLITNNPAKVTIVYATCYGYTKKMAEHLRDQFIKEDKMVSFYEIDALNYKTLKPVILENIQNSGTVLFGSPTVLGDAIPLFYDLLNSKPGFFFLGKKGSVFGDYGWSGEAVANLSAFMTMKKFKVVEGFRYAFKVDADGIKALDEYFERIK